MFGTTITNVEVEKLNLDDECLYDLVTGRGIRLQSVDSFSQKADKFTKKYEKVWDGLQSEFFGTDFGDDTAFAERWSCKCKKYIGMAYKNKICEVCNQPVQKIDIDLTKTGWIIIDHFKYISPIYDQKLLTALGTMDGEHVLNKILEVNYDDVGNIEYTEKEMVQLKKHPYIHKGMIWLSNPMNLLEVLDYYEKKRPKTQKKLFDELKNDLFNIFVYSFPAYTSVLRTELPGEKGSKLFKLKINTLFGACIRISNFINAIDPEDFTDKYNTINKQLYAFQKEVRGVFDDTYKSFEKKPGIIMSKVIGGRYNYSARNIITPSSGVLRADEIGLAYSTFMELYRSELLNFYRKVQECTPMEASYAWKRATVKFDPVFYNIMEYMITDKVCKKYMNVLICRNPCRLCTA